MRTNAFSHTPQHSLFVAYICIRTMFDGSRWEDFPLTRNFPACAKVHRFCLVGPREDVEALVKAVEERFLFFDIDISLACEFDVLDVDWSAARRTDSDWDAKGSREAEESELLTHFFERFHNNRGRVHYSMVLRDLNEFPPYQRDELLCKDVLSALKRAARIQARGCKVFLHVKDEPFCSIDKYIRDESKCHCAKYAAFAK